VLSGTGPAGSPPNLSPEVALQPAGHLHLLAVAALGPAAATAIPEEELAIGNCQLLKIQNDIHWVYLLSILICVWPRGKGPRQLLRCPWPFPRNASITQAIVLCHCSSSKRCWSSYSRRKTRHRELRVSEDPECHPLHSPPFDPDLCLVGKKARLSHAAPPGFSTKRDRFAGYALCYLELLQQPETLLEQLFPKKDSASGTASF